MERYIARQPIFDTSLKVEAYELLYRGGADTMQANVTDGDRATRSLLSDAITVFGLPRLTNSKMAYVNFTENLILDGFVRMADPKEVAVELLETIQIDDALITQLKELKKQGYKLVLDDYLGDVYFDPILPLVDVVKVDFIDTDKQTQATIAKRLRKQGKTLLAEKVETKEEFDYAHDLGYSLFQGYFFERPMVLKQKSSGLAASSYIRLFREVRKPDIDIRSCGEIIRSDAMLTYQLFQKVHTMQYYRGNSIQSIILALMTLGTESLAHWIILLLAREQNVAYSDELVRRAYLRGVFIERLMELSPNRNRSNDGFLLGMFSLLDKIMGLPMEKVLLDIPISPDVNAALLGTEKNIFSTLLEFCIVYETQDPNLTVPNLNLRIDESEIPRIYMESIIEVDAAFYN